LASTSSPVLRPRYTRSDPKGLFPRVTGLPELPHNRPALAVRAAHRVAGRYPDAQLFLDLHGHTAGREPTDPAAALDIRCARSAWPASASRTAWTSGPRCGAPNWPTGGR
jgi:hypothetical protein